MVNIPHNAKKLIVKSYEHYSKTNTEEESMRLAMNDFKAAYKQIPSGYVHKQNINMQTAIAKSGFFSPSYYFNAVLSSDTFDGNHKVSSSLLKWIDDNNKVNYSGDVDHLMNNTGNLKYNGLFKLVNKSYESGKLMIKFVIDKGHAAYNDFVKNKSNYRGLSAEFYDPVVKDDMIISASGVGWTLTDNPANQDAGITSKE